MELEENVDLNFDYLDTIFIYYEGYRVLITNQLEVSLRMYKSYQKGFL